MHTITSLDELTELRPGSILVYTVRTCEVYFIELLLTPIVWDDLAQRTLEYSDITFRSDGFCFISDGEMSKYFMDKYTISAISSWRNLLDELPVHLAISNPDIVRNACQWISDHRKNLEQERFSSLMKYAT